MSDHPKSEAIAESEVDAGTHLAVASRKIGFEWLFDNPIIIKQARVRLKKSSLLTWVAMLSLLAMGHMWLEFQSGTQRYDRSAGYILGGMIFFLLIIGSQQTGLLAGSTRASGMLDFHRLSPQSPASLFAGFLIGGPLREYAIFGVGTIFFLAACALYGTNIPGALMVLAAIIVLVLLFHGLSIVSAMLARVPTNNAAKGAGAAAWGVIISMMFLGPLFSRAMAIDRLASDPLTIPYFGFDLPWYVIFMLLGCIAFVFFAIAGVRRLRDDIRPSLSKKQAIVAFGLSIFAGLGFLSVPVTLIDNAIYGGMMLGICTTWIVLSFILIPTTAPDRVSYIGGLRRSLRLGHRRSGPFADRSVNRWAVAAMAVMLTLGISCTSYTMSTGVNGFDFPGASSATIVLILIEFGLALQYFRLRLGKNAGGAMLLFVFMMWVLPIIVGVMILSAAAVPFQESSGFIAMSVSPFMGVLFGSGVTDIMGVDSRMCQLAALLPTLTAVFIFNMLISNLQKRIDKRILPDHTAKDADPFAWLDQATPRDLVSGKKRKPAEKPTDQG